MFQNQRNFRYNFYNTCSGNLDVLFLTHNAAFYKEFAVMLYLHKCNFLYNVFKSVKPLNRLLFIYKLFVVDSILEIYKEQKFSKFSNFVNFFRLEYSFDVTIIQTPDVKELNLTRRYKLILGNLSIILRQRMPLPNDLSEPEPIYTWYYADIRRYSFSKQMREFAIYCGRNCPTPEKIICFRVKTDLVQLLQVVNEKTGGAFEAELASIKVKKRVCVVS